MKGKDSPMFSKGSDMWRTPVELFQQLNREFDFTLDGAADAENKLCFRHLGPGSGISEDALSTGHLQGERIFCNPPYSNVADFAKWAATCGADLVAFLVPSRTDTRWWHSYVWDGSAPRPSVEVRFIKGRLKFIDPTKPENKNSAPFPSVVVIFRAK